MRTVRPGAWESGCIFLPSRGENKNATEWRPWLSYPAENFVPETATSGRDHLNAEAVDVAAVDRVLAGDTAAFEEIVRRWQGPLVNMAWRYCRDRSRAEEMAQEAFVRAWRGLAHWRRESSFSTWLFALAGNVYRSELKRVPAVVVPIEEIAEPASAARGQYDALAEQRRDEVVRKAVLALPVRYREPVILYYFHEMDVSAAARTMRLPEGTVKARLARGRELLRKRFPHLNEAGAAMSGGVMHTGKEAIE